MSKLLINENPLQVLPKLACKIGLNEAIVLQQIHYWLETNINMKDEKNWCYNSIPDWKKKNFPFWSESTIKRIFKNLEQDKLLVVGNFNKMKIDRTKWHRIDYKKLSDIESTKDENDRPSGQNDPTKESKWPDGSGQNDPTNNQRLPETTKESKNTLSAKPKPTENLTNQIKDIFDKGCESLFGETLNWETKGQQYGQHIKSLIKMARSKNKLNGKGLTDVESKLVMDTIRQKARTHFEWIKADDPKKYFVTKKNEFSPSTLVSNWNNLNEVKKKEKIEIGSPEYYEHIKTLSKDEIC